MNVPATVARPRTLREELGNLPNMITMGRILVIPFFIVLLVYESRRNCFFAAVIYSLAAISDVVDGWLARKRNLITTIGKFLDPIADKLIVMSALVMLLRVGRVPAWVVIVIVAREFIINGLRSIAAGEGLVIAAGQGGKWKTSLQLVAIICLLTHYPYTIDIFVDTVSVDFHVVGIWLLYISLVPSVLSASSLPALLLL